MALQLVLAQVIILLVEQVPQLLVKALELIMLILLQVQAMLQVQVMLQVLVLELVIS